MMSRIRNTNLTIGDAPIVSSFRSPKVTSYAFFLFAAYGPEEGEAPSTYDCSNGAMHGPSLTLLVPIQAPVLYMKVTGKTNRGCIENVRSQAIRVMPCVWQRRRKYPCLRVCHSPDSV